MARAEADRNLLFGVLTLQMDFIGRDALIAGMNAWVLDKPTPLGRILVARGDLAAELAALIDSLVDARLGRAAAASAGLLGAARDLRSTVEELSRIDDPEVRSGLATLAPTLGDPEPFDPGRTLSLPPQAPPADGGRFRVIALHAEGGLGRVFVARDLELDREVALKEIRERYADDPASRDRFVLEAEITGNLEHPGIAPIYSLGRHPDGRPFYAMRLIRGETLHDAIARFHRATEGDAEADPAERALGFRRLIGRFLDVCNAIAYAHSRGILHRDLKPRNVMLGTFGETVVLDWGLAKPVGRPEHLDRPADGTLRPPSADRPDPTRAGSALGSPGYMSPEQARGEVDRLGPPCDVFGLGATLYCLLTGRPPFDGPDTDAVLAKALRHDFPAPRSLRPEIPPALEAICLRAMAREPADRHPGARELAEAVERWLGDEPVQAYRAAVADYDRLVAVHPDAPKYREGLARGRADLGGVLHVLGRFGEAEAEYRRAIDAYRSLVGVHPYVLPYREGLAASLMRLGRLLATIGRDRDARDSHRAAYDEYERLVVAAPHAEDYRMGMEASVLLLGGVADDDSSTLALDGASHYDEDDSESASEVFAIDETPIAPESRPVAPAPPAAAAPLADDGLIAGRYRILHPLARGGMGQVNVAFDERLGRKVVFKELVSRLADSSDMRARFALEIDVMASLEHAGVVPIYDAGHFPDGRPFYAMRLVKGGSLRDAIDRFHRESHRDETAKNRGLRRLVRHVVAACHTVRAAHDRGIVHRDLKPSNLLITPYAETFVMDWMLAASFRGALSSADSPLRPRGIDSLTTATSGGAVGTPAFMSPEQAAGDLELLGPRSDVYGLGATLYQILTGSVPFADKDLFEVLTRVRNGDFPPPRKLKPEIPEALEGICLQAMARAPEDRYATCLDLALDLERWLDGELPGGGLPARLGRWFGRGK